MWDGCRVIWSLLIGLFRSRATLEAENLVLRQQILVLRRTAPKRLSFNALDRLIFVGLYRLFPVVRSALAVVRPETVVRWHRAGFRAYWRWKSRPRSGRPKVPFEIRQLIRDMSLANPLWGALAVLDDEVAFESKRFAQPLDHPRGIAIPQARYDRACHDWRRAARPPEI
jgi:hypothetical protein